MSVIVETAKARREDFVACLSFFSRLPMRHDEPPDFARVGWALPFVGLTLGAAAGLVAAGASLAGLPNVVAATCALLVLAALTGGLHEDGIADFTDGLGGVKPEERLAIMRDPRIGSFGGLALVFSVLLRAGALAAILERGPLAGFLALTAACVVSRAWALAPLALLPPARPDGLGAFAVASKKSLLTALCLGFVLAAALWGPVNPIGAVFGLVLASGAALGVTFLARRALGGQTGDAAGAATQAAEIAFLIGASTLIAT